MYVAILGCGIRTQHKHMADFGLVSYYYMAASVPPVGITEKLHQPLSVFVSARLTRKM